MVDFSDRRTSLIQAKLNRTSRKPCGVFHSIEPLFFDSRDELAIDDNRGGGVRMIGVDAQNDH
jgi:hypothetical protein